MYAFAIAAGAMALYFVVAAVQRPRPAGILAAVLWGAYSVYEYYVANGTLCDTDCNIRVDLVLFLPLLGSAAYLAFRKEPRRGAVAILYVICLGIVAWVAAAFGYIAVAVVAGVATLIAAAYGLKPSISGSQA
ncbi:hypothetical protein [Hyphomicrobium zavarzinii]|uniref:hypothetical protein n=1 Tax=Hyphomicrobium zavarzinii TaxID=48292 RepID=UPI00037B75E1|nr:hypothetical protein [Hyphomicrobium zavarzinii]